jgi:hypothetical protein
MQLLIAVGTMAPTRCSHMSGGTITPVNAIVWLE